VIQATQMTNTWILAYAQSCKYHANLISGASSTGGVYHVYKELYISIPVFTLQFGPNSSRHAYLSTTAPPAVSSLGGSTLLVISNQIIGYANGHY
jgi:hypothetical protein